MKLLLLLIPMLLNAQIIGESYTAKESFDAQLSESKQSVNFGDSTDFKIIGQNSWAYTLEINGDSYLVSKKWMGRIIGKDPTPNESVALAVSVLTKPLTADINKCHQQVTEFLVGPDFKFESCNKKSARYEDKLLSLPVNHDWLDNGALCILESMKNAPDKHYKNKSSWKGNTHYPQCSNSGVSFTNANTRPCLSKKYLHHTVRSYRKALSCLGLDEKEIFGLINRESRFQTTIGNTNFVYGAAQLTPPGVFEVHRLLGLSPMVNHHTSNKSIDSLIDGKYVQESKCKEILEITGNKPIKTRGSGQGTDLDTCSRVHMPEHPGLSFLYAGILYKHLKKGMRDKINELGIKFDNKSLEPFIRKLTYYAYNGGPKHPADILETYIVENNVKEITQKNYALHTDGVRDFIIKLYPRDRDTGKHLEVGNYYNHIRDGVVELDTEIRKFKKDVSCGLY